MAWGEGGTSFVDCAGYIYLNTHKICPHTRKSTRHIPKYVKHDSFGATVFLPLPQTDRWFACIYMFCIYIYISCFLIYVYFLWRIAATFVTWFVIRWVFSTVEILLSMTCMFVPFLFCHRSTPTNRAACKCQLEKPFLDLKSKPPLTHGHKTTGCRYSITLVDI